MVSRLTSSWSGRRTADRRRRCCRLAGDSLLRRHLNDTATDALVLTNGDFELDIVESRLNVFESIRYQQFADEQSHFASIPIHLVHKAVSEPHVVILERFFGEARARRDAQHFNGDSTCRAFDHSAIPLLDVGNFRNDAAILAYCGVELDHINPLRQILVAGWKRQHTDFRFDLASGRISVTNDALRVTDVVVITSLTRRAGNLDNVDDFDFGFHGYSLFKVRPLGRLINVTSNENY